MGRLAGAAVDPHFVRVERAPERDARRDRLGHCNELLSTRTQPYLSTRQGYARRPCRKVGSGMAFHYARARRPYRFCSIVWLLPLAFLALIEPLAGRSSKRALAAGQ